MDSEALGLIAALENSPRPPSPIAIKNAKRFVDAFCRGRDSTTVSTFESKSGEVVIELTMPESKILFSPCGGIMSFI